MDAGQMEQPKPDFKKQFTLEEMIQLGSGGSINKEKPKEKDAKEEVEVTDGKVRVPGPGAHGPQGVPKDLMTRPAAPSFSMAGGWFHETMREDEVGPGRYRPNEEPTRRRSPGWGFGSPAPTKSKKRPQKQRGPDLTQGDSITFDRAPRYGFGSIDRFKPTPGTFVLGSPLGHGKDCCMPGPGQHHIKEDATSKGVTSPNFSFASENRALVSSRPGTKKGEKPPVLPGEAPSDFPGPGEYKISMGESHTARASPRCKFGSTPRMAVCAPTRGRKTPGPDKYATNNMMRTGHAAVGGSSPQWSFGGRHKDFALDGHIL